MTVIVNNAGGGNCGYYAMAIGLINICKERQALIEKWRELDPELRIDEGFFIDFDLSEMQRDSHYKKEELDRLQQSLRNIVYQAYILEYDASHDVRNTHLYNQFASLVESYRKYPSKTPSKDFNELAHSTELLKLAQSCVGKEEPGVIATFKDNINKIQQGTRKITEKGHWATDQEMRQIAETFGINLSISGKNLGQPDAEKPTVVLNNHGNVHWTTSINNLEPQHASEPSAIDEISKIVIKSNLPIAYQVDVLDMINGYLLGELEKKATSPDEKLALELQAQEFSNVGIKKK